MKRFYTLIRTISNRQYLLPKLSSIALLLCSCWSPVVYSAWSPDLKFSGFGTLGYSVLDNDTARYRVGLGRDGTTSDGSFLLDTRIAVQADAELMQFLTGTVQLLAREDQQGDFEQRLEWGYLQYRLSHVYAVRGGRLSLPVFMLSESREVAYSTPYLRLPEDLYQQIPIRSYEGVDILADLSLGDWYINAQGFVGGHEEKIVGNIDSGSTGGGVNVSVEYSNARFRFSQMFAKVHTESPEIDQIRAGLEQAAPFVPSANALLKDFQRGTKENPADVSWTALGLQLDFDSYFIDAEYAYLFFDYWLPSVSAWSVSGGYNFRTFTPYAIVSAARQEGQSEQVVFPDSPELNALAAGIESVTASPDQNTVALGIRWDVAPKLALKFQVDHIHRKDQGSSFRDFSNTDNADDGKDVTLYSLNVDFVF